VANYLLALTHGSGPPRLQDVLDELAAGAPADVVRRGLDHTWSLTWVAREAKRDLLRDDSGLFTGFSYDDEREELSFGSRSQPPGRAVPDTDLPGCHLAVSWDSSELTVRGDLYRSMPIFVTTERGLTLMSDSPYVLLRLRRRLGLPATTDPDVAGSLRWGNAMSAQLMSTRTLVKEIDYVAVGQRVRIPLDADGATAEIRTRPLREVFAWDGRPYGETIRQAASRIASVIHTIASMGPQAARLSLSGGKDSRICLAAALLSPAARTGGRFSCTNTLPQHRRDFHVVQALSEEFGFSVGSAADPVARARDVWRVPDPVALWYQDQALAYFPVKIQSYGLRSKTGFAIAGYGPELYRGNYGLRSVRQIVESIARTSRDIASDVQTVCGGYLEAVGIDPAEPFSAEWHYLGMRNALHGGRFVPVTKLGIRPLQQRSLVGLSKLPPAERPVGMSGPEGVGEDLMAVMSPALATRPFDLPAKDRTAEWVTARLKLLGGPLSQAELSSYTVLGSLTDVADGPLPALALLDEVDRPHGPLSRERVKELLAEASVIVEESPYGPTWRTLVTEAEAELSDPAIPVGQPRGMVGRVLSLAEALR
jgi:hypothetical protein